MRLIVALTRLGRPASAALAAAALAVAALASGLGAATASTASSGAGHPRLPLTPARLQADERAHDQARHLTTVITGVVRDPSGRPLPGVCVTAFGQSGARSGISASGGRFVIAGLRPGLYRLDYRGCASAGRYLPAWSGGALDSARATPIAVGGAPIQAVPTVTMRALRPAGALAGSPASAQQVSPIDAVRRALGLAARPPAAVAALGLGKIAGRVTNRAGGGLAGICAIAIGNGFGVGLPTGRRGFYAIADLPAGRYQVAFTGGCGNTANWSPEIYDHAASLAKATKVRVRAGRTTAGIDGVLRPGGQITGLVTGTGGRRLSNVCVAPVPVGNSALTGILQAFGSPAFSHDGAWALHNMPAGRYKLYFQPCATGGQSPYLPVWWKNASSPARATALMVVPGHPVGHINQQLPLGGSITGTVSGSAANPLPGMCVTAQGAGPNGYFSFPATTDSHGAYTIAGLPAGTYQIQTQTGCGNNGNYVPTNTPFNVKVTLAHVTAGVNVTMPTGATVSGTVTDTRHNPVGGICATVSGGPYGEYGGQVVTHANGRYSINQLPAATYTIEFSGGCGNAGSYAPQAWSDTNPGSPTPVKVATAQQVTGIDAMMQPGATITGHVTTTGGRPVSGACVAALTPAFAWGGLTGAPLDGLAVSRRGHYRLANVPSGQYDIIFAGVCGASQNLDSEYFQSRPGPGGASAVWAAAGSVTAGINGVLGPAGAISGTLRTAAGRALRGGTCLTVTNLADHSQDTYPVFDFFGSGVISYELTGVRPGPYQVAFISSCIGSNYAAQWYKDSPTPRGARTIMVRAGHTVGGVSSALVRGGTISGRVTAAGSGTPLGNVCVFGQSTSQAGLYGFGTTDKRGFYRVVGLGTARYELFFQPCNPGGDGNAAPLTLPRLVSVRAGQAITGIDAALGGGGTITGTVTGGQPSAGLPAVCVQATPAGSSNPTGFASTAADGSYLLPNLVPGSYRIEAYAQPDCDGAGLFSPATHQGLVTVSAGDTASGVALALGQEATVSGMVKGPGGVTLTGICVAAVGTSPGSAPVIATTSGGRYSIGGLLPGSYRVRFASGCGAAGYRTQWWKHAGSERLARILRVKTGSLITAIDATLAR